MSLGDVVGVSVGLSVSLSLHTIDPIAMSRIDQAVKRPGDILSFVNAAISRMLSIN